MYKRILSICTKENEEKMNIKSKAFVIISIFVELIYIYNAEAKQKSTEKTNKYECEIEFELGKSDLKQMELEKCVKQIPEDEYIKYVQIISSANQLGTFEFNKKLSDKRLEVVHSYLKKHLKNIETKVLSIGKNSQLDKKVYVLILAAKRKNPEVIIVEKKVVVTQKTTGESEKKLPPTPLLIKETSDIEYFIGFRLGRDIYMHDQIEPYFAYGLLAGINIQKFDYLNFELGLSANHLTNDSVLAITNFYGFAGANLISGKHSGVYIGIRGLGGGVANQKEQIDADFGGEARIGYENSTFNLGFGAGRTNYTTRIGIELSFKL